MNTDQTLRALHAVRAVASEARQGASPATLADALALAVERLAGPLEAAGVTRDQVAAAFAVTTVEDAHGPRPAVARARPTVAADDNGQPVAVPAWRPADDAQDQVGRLLAALLYLEAMAARGEALPAGTAAYLDTTAGRLAEALRQSQGRILEQADQANQASANGRKGGRPAGGTWQEAVAEHVVESLGPKVSGQDAWRSLGPDDRETIVERGMKAWRVWTDGDQLKAADEDAPDPDDAPVVSIKRRTFLETYLPEARKKAGNRPA